MAGLMCPSWGQVWGGGTKFQPYFLGPKLPANFLYCWKTDCSLGTSGSCLIPENCRAVSDPHGPMGCPIDGDLVPWLSSGSSLDKTGWIRPA